MTISAVPRTGYDSITGPLNQTETICPVRNAEDDIGPPAEVRIRVDSVISTAALREPLSSEGFSSTTRVAPAILVIVPRMSGRFAAESFVAGPGEVHPIARIRSAMTGRQVFADLMLSDRATGVPSTRRHGSLPTVRTGARKLT